MITASSSSWGCELKYLFFQCPCDRIQSSSSWGCELKYKSVLFLYLSRTVILFVRMWVEMSVLSLNTFATSSSSSWGCELKWAYKTRRKHRDRHPPREDVGWNLEEYGVNHRCSNMVFLVGRWIEISLIVFLSFARRSHYYTSFNLNIKLNYRNLRGNFYMCF